MYQNVDKNNLLNAFISAFRSIARDYGEADLDYTAHPAAKFAWLYFIIMTALVVIFGTMMVAIVSDTFVRINKAFA
jgi:hypothetical protein